MEGLYIALAVKAVEEVMT